VPFATMNDCAHSGGEWIEPNGPPESIRETASSVRSRRYHTLRLARTNSDAGRLVLVNGFEAWVEINGDSRSLASHRYAPDAMHPDSDSRIDKFEATPWPHWYFQLTERLTVEQEIFTPRGRSSVVIGWRLIGHSNERVKLKVRLFYSDRNSHSPQQENDGSCFESYSQGDHFIFDSQPNVPAVVAETNAFFLRDPIWHHFL
jgi:glycogen debranching enzyme